jgi:hypothetical protein
MTVEMKDKIKPSPVDLLPTIKANYLKAVGQPANFYKLDATKISRVAGNDTYRIVMWIRKGDFGAGVGPSNYVHVDSVGNIVKMES